jgi:hypothetical protein
MATKVKKTTARKTPNDKQIPISGALEIVTAEEDVSPVTAAEWLQHNTNNRSVMTGVVDQYAALMKAGLWRLTHESIAFGANGEVYDGQHRLLAIVKAGVTVRLRVTRGLSPEARDAIDTGRGRRARDVLAITDGIRLDTNTHAAVIAAHWLTTNGSLLWTRTRSDVHALRAAKAEHLTNVNALVEILASKHDRLSNAALVGSLAVARRTCPDRVDEFAALLRSGASLPEGSPVLALRNHLTLQYDGSGGQAREDLSLRTFAALDAFVRGETRVQLKRSETARARYLAPWRKTEEG